MNWIKRSEKIGERICDFVTNKDGSINIAKTILVIASSGLLFSGVLLSQDILNIFPTSYQTKQYRRKVQKSIDYLKRTQVISTRNGMLGLTSKGEVRLKHFIYDQMVIKAQTKWDGKWRIVIFDIPEKYKSKRDALRSKLKTLGFYPIQISSWAYPYPCAEEVEFIRSINEIRTYVSYLETSFLENDTLLKSHFKLK